MSPRRDDWLARAARTRSEPGRRPRRWRRGAVALLLGWLVLMTIWGIGRSGFPELVGWFLAVGLIAGAVTTAVTWRRPH